MKKSLSEIKRFALEKKGENETIYAHYFLRRISPLFTWMFLRLRVSANFVTALALLTALIGSIMFWSESIAFWCAGWVLYQLYYILDCSDGEVAALTETTSEFGAFMDKISHPITNSIIIYMSAFGAYQITGNIYLLAFSASGAIAFNLTSVMRYFAQQNTSTESQSQGSTNTDSILAKSLKVAKNLATRPGGITHPLLGFLILDATTGGNWRIFYPALTSFFGLIFVLKRFFNIRNSM